MTDLLGTADYIVIGLMLAVSASVGLYFRFTGGRQKTTQEFLMAGKNMSIGPVAFSLMATYMSAISVLGLPAETYLYGTQYIWWMVGMPLGGLACAFGFLPVFYETGVTTAYEYLEKRFGKILRTVSALLFTLQMIFYMAVVLYAPSLALNAVTGLSTWASVISLAVVCTFYCSLGGLKAVLWTDVFQALLMYVTIIAVMVKGAINVGGLQNVNRIAAEGGRLIFFNMTTDVTVRYTFWNALMSGILFSIHTFGTNQAQIQRMLSVGNLKKAQKALFWSLPLIFIFNIFCFWDGVVIYSNYHNCDPMLQPHNNINLADQLMPYFIVKMFGHMPGLSGLCIAGVFSASLSTVSSAVNSLTAVTMEDFIRPFCFCKSLTESWAALLAKVLAIGYGGLCLLLTFIVANFRGVMEASNVMFGMIGGPVLGIYVLGMFSTTANEEGALIGLVIGFFISAWIGFGSYAAKLKIPTLPLSTVGCPAYNSTFTLLSNETNLVEENLNRMSDALISTEEEERYILPIYKISYTWFPFIGCVIVLLVGYISSFVIGFFKEQLSHDPENFSPFVRRWFFKSVKSVEVNLKVHPEVEMEMKAQNGNLNANNCLKIAAVEDS